MPATLTGVLGHIRHDGQVATLIDDLHGVLLVEPGGRLKPLGKATLDIARDIHERFADDLQIVRSYFQEHAR